MSSDALKTQIDAGLQAGFYRYLTKPFKLTDLLDAIENSLGYTSERYDRYDRFSSSPGSNAMSVQAPDRVATQAAIEIRVMSG